MHEVFINYRTGDGDEAATLIERALADRFGTGRIFRAAKSIAPGELYPEALLTAARRSTVLLAVMGPNWSRCPQLRDENDWVRREILAAYDAGKAVIPVLKGRKTDRLDVTDLPAELVRLADVQSLRLDTRDSEADLMRIGDVLADLVPALKQSDLAASRPPALGDVRNSGRKVRGTIVQGRDIAGDAGTVIKGNHGPVHAGRGDLYQDSQHFSGYGAAYVEGDNQGGISHHFGGSRKDDER
jgi:TIR domain